MALIRWSSPVTSEEIQRLIRLECDPRRALEIFRSASAEPSYSHDPATLSLLLSRLPPSILFPILPSLPLPLPEHPFPSLLHHLSRRRNSPIASLRLFHRMGPEFHCPPTSPSFVTMLDILVDADHLRDAHQLYKQMRKAGYHNSLPARNVVLKAFLKSENTLGAALKLFDEMTQRDSYTYGTMISGLCKLGHLEKALDVFRGISGAPNVVAYSAAIHGLCSHGKLDDALELFDEMRDKAVKPNVVTFCTLVDGLCKGRRAKEATGILESMARSGYPPNVATYSLVVCGLCKGGMLKEAMEVVCMMRFHGRKPDVRLYRKLIVLLVDSRRCHEAANLLDEVVVFGEVFSNRLNWSLHMEMYNLVIRGLCSDGRDPARALQVYLGARTCRVSVEMESFHVLISGLCKKGYSNKAALVMEDMVRVGFLPDGSDWDAVMNCLYHHEKKARDAAESTLESIYDECRYEHLNIIV